MADIDKPEDLTGEDQHYQALVDAGLIDPEEENAEAAEVDETEGESTPEVEEKPTEEEEAAAEEFFPGYSQLPEESQKIVRDRMEAAEKAAELQQRLQQSERDRSAIQGRLAPTQRELEAYRTKLREIEKSNDVTSKSGAEEVLARFAKQYPEEAEALQAVNNQFKSFAEKSEREKEELLAVVNEIRQNFEHTKAEQETQREAERLKQFHPDFMEIDQDPEFHTWLKAIDEPKRKFFHANSRNAEALASVLSDFKRDRDYARLLQGQGDAAPANTPASKPLARKVADPNPTSRRPTAIPRSNPTAGLAGEEKHVADLRAAGYDV
jgi:hypothetical protein